MPRRIITVAAFAIALTSPPALAAETAAGPPKVELSAEANSAADNDQASAEAYVEATGEAPGPLAERVNAVIRAALKSAEAYPAVRVRSAGTHTGPIYGEDRSSGGRREIRAWRMRSALALESTDLQAMSALLGKLQASMAVGEMRFSPSNETRRAAEDDALVQALKNFEARAALVAGTLGRQYRIQSLSIGTAASRPPPLPMARTAMLSAEAAPAPAQAGRSEVTVTVSGSIELID